jgi:hypothetical protein
MLEVLGPAGLKIGRVCGFRGFLLLWGLGVFFFFFLFFHAFLFRFPLVYF